jgi:hypothetical protein
MSAPKYMKMQMKHGLPTIATSIRHNAIAGFGQPFVCRHLSAGQQELSQQRLIRLTELLDRRHMPFGNHQRVDRRLRRNVVERERVFILIHKLGRDSPFHDPAKDAGTHTSSLTTFQA